MTFSSIKKGIRTSIAYFVFFSGIAFIRASILKRREPLVRVLLVHHIKDAVRFEKIIRHIARRYNPISYHDLVRGNFHPTKINILFTMDDGYASWYATGLPLLEKYNVPALFFISSTYMRNADDAQAVASFSRENLKLSWNAEPLSESMLMECARHSLITVGGHTCTHPFLTYIAADEAQREISEDKNVLEKTLGTTISVFAYPFGNYNADVKAMVMNAGYSCAMTTKSNFYSRKDDPFLIPRSNHGTTSSLDLSIWVSGAYDVAESVFAFMRKLSEK